MTKYIITISFAFMAIFSVKGQGIKGSLVTASNQYLKATAYNFKLEISEIDISRKEKRSNLSFGKTNGQYYSKVEGLYTVCNELYAVNINQTTQEIFVQRNYDPIGFITQSAEILSKLIIIDSSITVTDETTELVLFLGTHGSLYSNIIYKIDRSSGFFKEINFYYSDYAISYLGTTTSKLSFKFRSNDEDILDPIEVYDVVTNKQNGLVLTKKFQDYNLIIN